MATAAIDDGDTRIGQPQGKTIGEGDAAGARPKDDNMPARIDGLCQPMDRRHGSHGPGCGCEFNQITPADVARPGALCVFVHCGTSRFQYIRLF
jgi:hypothetical protein